MDTDCSCSFLWLHSFVGTEPLVRKEVLVIYQILLNLRDEQAAKQIQL